MPRYRFQWSNFPPKILAGLCRDLGIDAGDDPATALRSAYGARPDDSFVHETWHSLRDRWLGTDTEARKHVVATLWEAGVGSTGDYPSDKASELAYSRRATMRAACVRSCSKPSSRGGRK